MAAAAAAVTAVVRSALLSLGGGGNRRGGRWRVRSRPQKEAPPSAGLATNRINRKRKKAPLEGKKEKRRKQGREVRKKGKWHGCKGKGAHSDHPCSQAKANHYTWPLLALRLRVSRGNGIFQGNVQGDNSPAVRVPVSAATRSPGGRSEPWTERGNTAKETLHTGAVPREWWDTDIPSPPTALPSVRNLKAGGAAGQDQPTFPPTPIWRLTAWAGNGRQG